MKVSNLNHIKAFEKYFDNDIPTFLIAGNHDMSENPTVKHVRPFQMTFGEPYYHFQFGNRGKFKKKLLGVLMRCILLKPFTFFNGSAFGPKKFEPDPGARPEKMGRPMICRYDQLTFSRIKISLLLKPNFSAAKNH